jgi:hypothetical protein
VSDNDRTSGDINQTTPTSSVVSLPPVRKTRSNPTAATAHEKVAKPAGPPRQQHTLLNIQKDVEWLAKHQSRQRHNAVQSKASTISQGEISANIITTSPSHHKGSTHYLNHKQNFTCRVKALRRDLINTNPNFILTIGDKLNESEEGSSYEHTNGPVPSIPKRLVNSLQKLELHLKFLLFGTKNLRCFYVHFSVKMSKIPQRVKEPSSYARIFAKHKASQSRKDEIAEEPQTCESTTNEGPLGSSADIEGSHGSSRVQHGTSRVPLYGTNHFNGEWNFSRYSRYI